MRPYEKYAFLSYDPGRRKDDMDLQPVAVKYMKMVKVHEDFVRYDFFHNCTDLLWFQKERELPKQQLYVVQNQSSDADYDTSNDTYPMIWKYTSKRFETVKYDVLHVFQDSYHIYEKSSQIPIEDSSDYEGRPEAKSTIQDKTNTDKHSEGNGKGMQEMISKAMAAVGSFLFIGILKWIFQMEFVKNLLKEVNVDDEKAEVLRKSVSSVVNKNIAKTLGFGYDQ